MLISFLSCKVSPENPEEASSISRYEKMPDSEIIQTDSEGKTFLHFAAAGRDTELEKYLLKRGLAIDQKDNNDFTPLHESVHAKQSSAIQILLDHNADVHSKTKELNTPLHLAVFNNDIQSAEILFFNGAHSDILTENSDGISPLSHAIKNRYYEMAELLYFPMHHIIKRNKPEYFVYLIKSKESVVSSTDMRKMTPLHVAYLYQNQAFIDKLLGSGADSESLDIYGRKPLDYVGLDLFLC